MSGKVFLFPFLVSIAATCVLYHPDQVHDLFNRKLLRIFRFMTQVRDNDIRVTRDVTNCGPNDTAPPNRVNTSLQLQMVRRVMVMCLIKPSHWPS